MLSDLDLFKKFLYNKIETELSETAGSPTRGVDFDNIMKDYYSMLKLIEEFENNK